MRGRVGGLGEDLPGAAIGLVVDALPPLVLDDIPLRVQLLQIEGIEQKPHPIGLHPQRRLEIVRWHGLEVGRAIVRRRAVVRSADALGQLVVQAVRHVPGPGEHHVLEEVREPGAAFHLVLRSHVVPHVHRDGRSRPVDRGDDRQPVRQRVGLEGNIDGGRGPLRYDGVGDEDDRERRKDSAYSPGWSEIALHRSPFLRHHASIIEPTRGWPSWDDLGHEGGKDAETEWFRVQKP